MPGGPGEYFTAPVDTVPAASPSQFTVRGYLESTAAQRVAGLLNTAATQSRNAAKRIPLIPLVRYQLFSAFLVGSKPSLDSIPPSRHFPVGGNKLQCIE